MNCVKGVLGLIVLYGSFLNAAVAADDKGEKPLSPMSPASSQKKTAKSKDDVVDKPTKEGGQAGAKKLVESCIFLIKVAEKLDELTTTKDGVKLISNGSTPQRQKTYFGIKYLVPKVTISDFYTNTVLGREIPGRRVTVKITVDCDVDCRILVDDITFAWSKDKPKTLIVTLPPLDLSASVPKGRKYDYDVEYGSARNPDRNSSDAMSFRKEMIRKVGDVAKEEFKQGVVFTALQEGLKSGLQDFLTAGCPKGTTVVIVFGGK
jgi:hypothetical protein